MSDKQFVLSEVQASDQLINEINFDLIQVNFLH
jgi:hypothetical protein